MTAASDKTPKLKETSALSKDWLCDGLRALSLPRITKATYGLGCDIHRVSHEKSLHIEIFQKEKIPLINRKKKVTYHRKCKSEAKSCKSVSRE